MSRVSQGWLQAEGRLDLEIRPGKSQQGSLLENCQLVQLGCHILLKQIISPLSGEAICQGIAFLNLCTYVHKDLNLRLKAGSCRCIQNTVLQLCCRPTHLPKRESSGCRQTRPRSYETEYHLQTPTQGPRHRRAPGPSHLRHLRLEL